MRFDLHCHTKEGSFDSKIPISEYISKYIMLGYNGFMITDHNSYKGCLKWEHMKRRKELDIPEDFTVLCGIEYDTKDAGHVLVIMPDGVYLPIFCIRGMRVSKLANFVHLHGGVLGLAHPFGIPSSSAMGFKLMKMEYIENLDFIEVFNTCENADSNRLARELAAKYNLPAFAGTDAHDPQYIGMACTEIDAEITCNNDLIKSVKMANMSITASGTEREETLKGKAKESWFSQIGYTIYNRGLGKINMIRRKYTHNKLIHTLTTYRETITGNEKPLHEDTEKADTEVSAE